MKKLISLVLALALVALCAVASAATITINRDSSWDENAENAEATYTYYKILDAKDIDQTVVTDTGEQATTSAGVAVYTVDSAEKAAALPSIFDVSTVADDGKYYVTLADENTTATQIASALKTLVEANTTLFPGTAVTSDDNPVVIDGLDAGYYLILASNGNVMAVQTLDDVTIKEKNDYPSITKEQKKAADSTYSEAVVPAEIGTYIDYQITVSIPTNANKDIVVVDKMTDGLEYDSTTGLTFNPTAIEHSEVATTDAGYDADATWQIKFTPTQYASYRGTDVVITYRALITAAALTDTGRENEVTLTYDDGNYVLKDHTDYTTYFGGIEKVDGSNTSTKLSGVKFDLTVGGNAFNVQAVLKGGDGEDKDDVLYYIPGGDSNEVITGENGLIIIRGLDNTKTYTLTETETNAGYNLLETPTNLTLVKDEGTAYSTNNYQDIENNKGTVLPSTGGIGTTIFYIVGGLLLVGAAIVLVARRKASN